MKRSHAWLRTGVVAGAAVAACQFTHGTAPGDGQVTDTPLDGPSMCPSVFQECASGSDALIVCAVAGSASTTTACPWGCLGSNGGSAAHCGALEPGGGAATGSDFDPAAPDATNLSGTIDGTTLKINNTPWPDAHVVSNAVGNVAIFRFKSLHVTGPVSLAGSNAIVFAVEGAVMIDDVIDGRPMSGCLTGPSGIAGPGGFAGGATGSAGAGSGGGAAAENGNKTEGGGGGGNGGSGGNGSGDNPPAGGSAYGATDLAIAILVGGGGGGGADNGGAVGGGGGAAFQIISNTSIAIGSNGGINVGGCGGHHGGGADSGGGGGAGGTMLLESPTMMLFGRLAANGGGGGGGSGGTDGSAGSLDQVPAPGGAKTTTIAVGGQGAAGSTLNGSDGTFTSGPDHSGGGGGGAGRIRLNTRTGAAAIDQAAIISPDPKAPGTTATQGAPVVH